VDDARQTMRDLAAVGVDIDKVMEKLIEEGVEKFEKSFDALFEKLDEKRVALAGAPVDSE
jgi:transaldolase